MSIGGSSMGSAAASVMQGNHQTSGDGVFGFNSNGIGGGINIEINKSLDRLFGFTNKNTSIFTNGIQTDVNASLGKGFDGGLSVSNVHLGNGLIGSGASR